MSTSDDIEWLTKLKKDVQGYRSNLEKCLDDLRRFGSTTWPEAATDPYETLAELGIELLERNADAELVKQVAAVGKKQNVAAAKSAFVAIEIWCDEQLNQSGPKKRWKTEDANLVVIQHLEKNPDATREQIHEATGIPTGTISNTMAWKRVTELRELNSKQGVVSHSQGLIETIGKRDPNLEALIQDQADDHEPSPLDKEGRSPRSHPDY